MKVRNLFFAALLAIGTAACAGDTEGMECESDDECEDGQICASLVGGCGDEGCPGICGVPCDTEEDCSSGRVCAETSGSAGRICQDSRTLGD